MAPPRTIQERALRLLGPLEARIMRAVWEGALAQRFLVREVHELLPELAYTTVMTTVSRLADKGLLRAEGAGRHRAISYRKAGSPAEFLRQSSRKQVDDMINRYGDAALAAFEVRLGELPADRRRRLQRLADG